MGLTWYVIAIAPLVNEGEPLASKHGQYSNSVWLWEAAEDVARSAEGPGAAGGAEAQ